MPTRPAKCGTDSGYYRHVRTLKEPACDACLTAHAAAALERKHRPAPDVRPEQHGRSVGYRLGCRCGRCRTAESVRKARYRDQRKVNASAGIPSTPKLLVEDRAFTREEIARYRGGL